VGSKGAGKGLVEEGCNGFKGHLIKGMDGHQGVPGFGMENEKRDL